MTREYKNIFLWLTTFQPPLGAVKAPTDLNGSLFMFWMYLLSDGPKAREQLSQGSAIIDVRDLAEVHVRSLETEKAGGEPIFAMAKSCIWQDLREWLTYPLTMN